MYLKLEIDGCPILCPEDKEVARDFFFSTITCSTSRGTHPPRLLPKTHVSLRSPVFV